MLQERYVSAGASYLTLRDWRLSFGYPPWSAQSVSCRSTGSCQTFLEIFDIFETVSNSLQCQRLNIQYGWFITIKSSTLNLHLLHHNISRFFTTDSNNSDGQRMSMPRFHPWFLYTACRFSRWGQQRSKNRLPVHQAKVSEAKAKSCQKTFSFNIVPSSMSSSPAARILNHVQLFLWEHKQISLLLVLIGQRGHFPSVATFTALRQEMPRNSGSFGGLCFFVSVFQPFPTPIATRRTYSLESAKSAGARTDTKAFRPRSRAWKKRKWIGAWVAAAKFAWIGKMFLWLLKGLVSY